MVTKPQVYHIYSLIDIPGPIHYVELAEDDTATILIHRRLTVDGRIGATRRWVVTDAMSGGGLTTLSFESVKAAKHWLHTKRDFILDKFKSGVREAFIRKHHKEKTNA